MTLFSVVVATYERGPAIATTLQSIADQTVDDLEVLVVSDGPPAAGLAETVAGFGPRFALHALPERTRSQSGPNNRGVALAGGRYVAYLGHDDLWLPEHLATMAAVFEQRPEVDFVVGGCLFLGPPGRVDELTWVTGIFDADDAAAPTVHFFPPSSVGHRRPLPAAVGQWSEDPAALRQPVDTEFLLGAAAAGCRFASTGRVSVVKFASALRYLSYLAPSDAEQRRAARLLTTAEARESFVAERVAAAREHDNFMMVRHVDPAKFEVGERLARNEQVRGIAVPTPALLGDSAWLEPGDEWRGFDWYRREATGEKVWRWSGPSTSPRLALPYTHPDPVHVRIHLRTDQGPTATVAGVQVDGEDTAYTVVPGPDGLAIELTATLRDRLASVVELEITGPTVLGDRSVGVALSGIELETRQAAALRGTSGDASRAALEARLARTTAHHDRLRADLDQVSSELTQTRQHATGLEKRVADLTQSLARVRRRRRRDVRRLRKLGEQRG